jgi:hypothetical protein
MRYAGAAFWLGTALEGEKLILDAFGFPPADKPVFTWDKVRRGLKPRSFKAKRVKAKRRQG